MARKRHSREDGYAIVMTTLALFTSVLIAGLGFDYSIIYLIQTKLQGASDAAATAAVRALAQNPSMSNAQTVGQEFLTANFPAGFMGARLSFPGNYGSVTVSRINWSGGAGTAGSSAVAKLVQVSGIVIAPLYFLSVTGTTSVPISTSAQGKREGLLIMLVMDGSDSMLTVQTDGNTACLDAAQDAQAFLGYSQWDTDIDRIGLVAFGGQTYTVLPTNNFQSSPGVVNTSNAVYTALTTYASGSNGNEDATVSSAVSAPTGCGGNTNTGGGLQAAYMAMEQFYQTEASLGNTFSATTRNRADIIVLMTDGAPNGFTANWTGNLTSGDSCVSTSTPALLVGYVTRHGVPPDPLRGILSTALNTGTNSTAAMGTPLGIPSKNCQWDPLNSGSPLAPNTAGLQNFYKDFTQYPSATYYTDTVQGSSYGDTIIANGTNSLIYPSVVQAYSTQGGQLNAQGDDVQLYQFSCNSADAAATRLRSDPNFRVAIYSIGVGGNVTTDDYDYVNPMLLYRMANTTGSCDATCVSDFYKITGSNGLEPPSLSYTANPNQLQGDYIQVANATVLYQAFQQIATEISARLSK